MTEVFGPVLSKGGPLAYAALAILALKYLIDAVRDRRKGLTEEASSSTTDLATANTALASNLGLEREGNAFLRQENNNLRVRNAELEDELIATKSTYEDKLLDLKRQLADLAQQVDALIAASPPSKH